MPETSVSLRPKTASTQETLRFPVTGSAVKRMPDDHRHVDFSLVDSVPQTIGHGPLGEERGPAPPDMLKDRRFTSDFQICVVLPRERSGRQILRSRAGSDGVACLFTMPNQRMGNRRRKIMRDGDRFERLSDLRAECTDRFM